MTKAKTTILVPVDFSPESIIGLKTALDIAKQTGSMILLVHLVSDSELDESRKENANLQQLIKERNEYLRGLRIQYHIPKLKVDFEVSRYVNKHKLAKYLQNRQIDLIVLGKKTKNYQEDFLIEYLHVEENKSVKDVIVLAVDHYCGHLNYHKLLLGINPKNYDEDKLTIMNMFASLLNMEIVVAPAVPIKQKKQLELWRNHIEELTHNYPYKNYTFLSPEVSNSNEKLNLTIQKLNIDFGMETTHEHQKNDSLPPFSSLSIHEISQTKKEMMVV